MPNGGVPLHGLTTTLIPVVPDLLELSHAPPLIAIVAAAFSLKLYEDVRYVPDPYKPYFTASLGVFTLSCIFVAAAFITNNSTAADIIGCFLVAGFTIAAILRFFTETPDAAIEAGVYRDG